MDKPSPLNLAFVDPGLRKAPFFLELRPYLEPGLRCVYYSRRTIVRGYIRSAKAPQFPNLWRPARQYTIADEDLIAAIGPKEWATRGAKLMPRARRLLGDLDAFFEEQSIDAILVWNGSNLLLSLAVYLARKRGIPVVFAEHGYLPATLQLDGSGVNFDSSVTGLALRGAAALPPDPALDQALDREIEAYRSGKPMRTGNAPVPRHLRSDVRAFFKREIYLKSKTWVRKKFAGVGVDEPALPERFVFLPFQVRKDSQLIVHSPLVGNDMARLLGLLQEALARVDPGMRIVVKMHPRENPRVQARYIALMRRYPEVLFIRRHRLTELLEKAAAVVTVNSTVGFEAFLYDKPVVALGRNFYTAPHLVQQVRQLEEFPDALRRALQTPVDLEQRRAFLRYVYARFLSFGNYNDYSEASLRAVADKIHAILELPTHRSASTRAAGPAPAETAASDGDASSTGAGIAAPAVR